MPPYHSQIPDEEVTGKVIGNTPLLPLKVTKNVMGHTTTVTRGVVPTPPGETDIVDEALDLFKANIFFSTYEVKGHYPNNTKHNRRHQFIQDFTCHNHKT